MVYAIDIIFSRSLKKGFTFTVDGMRLCERRFYFGAVIDVFLSKSG